MCAMDLASKAFQLSDLGESGCRFQPEDGTVYWDKASCVAIHIFYEYLRV